MEGDGLAGTLGHPDHLAVPQQLHQLHEHDIQPLGAIKAQRVQCALQAGHMAVMVGAPDVDDLVEAPDSELIAVIGDIRGEIGVEAVGPAEHVILQIQLFNVRFLFALLAEVIPQNIGRLQPQSAVLFVGPALFRQQVHSLGYIAALVEGRLVKPGIVMDLIALQIRLHAGQVHRKAELSQSILPLLLGDIQQAVTMLVIIGLGQFLDVLALIAILREGDGILAIDKLEVTDLDGTGKLVNLVSGVIDIELSGHIRAAGGEDGGQRIAQHAAPGVAHVHGSGGVGGDELNHDLLTLETVIGAVDVLLRFHGVHDAGIPLVSQTEVQKAGASDLRRGKVGAGEIHVVQQRLSDHAGRLAQCLGGRQSKGGGIVAVGGILGDLYGGGLDLCLRQSAVRRSRLVGCHCQRRSLVLRVLDHIRHIVKPFLRLNLSFISAGPGS